MNKNKNFFAVALFVAAAFLALSPLKAQVTIGAQTPPHSTLEVVALPAGSATPDGIMAPQISGDNLKIADGKYGTEQNGVLVYVTAAVTTASTKTINVKKPGYYYYDAPNQVWVAVGSGKEEWFYMPSFNLPLSDPVNHPDGKGLTFDLWQEYYDQFNGTASQTTPPDPSVAFFAASGDGSAAPTSVTSPPYPRNQLIFYVTAYSHDVIKVNSISSAGVLNYDVVSGVVPDGSFINVIFKVINK